MKTLKQYIIEYSTPDKIQYHKYDITLGWCSELTTAFVFNTQNTFLLAAEDKGLNHIELLKYFIHVDCLNEESEWRHELGLEDRKFKYIKNAEDLAETRLIKWYNFKQRPDHLIFGRIWDLSLSKNKHLKTNELIIAYWNDLEPNYFKELTNKLLKFYCKTNNLNLEDFTVYVVDNNNQLINFTDDVKIDVRSKENKQLMDKIQQIHLATQQEKEEYYKLFKRNRDERNQITKYNKTKSKTEAEWRAQMYQENKNK